MRSKSKSWPGYNTIGTTAGVFKMPLSTWLFLARIVAICLWLTSCRSTPLVSDEQLEKTFRANQAEFNRLVAMSIEDRHVTTIAPSYTRLDTSSRWPREEIGFSQQRWDEYRALFKKLGIPKGIGRHDSSPSSPVYFHAEARGPVTTGSYKGYVYSEKPLAPLLNSLDELPDEVVDHKAGHALAYKALAKNWYLFHEEY